MKAPNNAPTPATPTSTDSPHTGVATENTTQTHTPHHPYLDAQRKPRSHNNHQLLSLSFLTKEKAKLMACGLPSPNNCHSPLPKKATTVSSPDLLQNTASAAVYTQSFALSAVDNPKSTNATSAGRWQTHHPMKKLLTQKLPLLDATTLQNYSIIDLQCSVGLQLQSTN